MAASGGGSGGAPLTVASVMKLPAIGIASENITFRSAAMTSDKAVCIREKTPDGKAGVAIVDVTTGRIASRRPLTAEGAALSPDAKLIAVRGKGVMQIWNLEVNKRVKSSKAPEGEKIVYWTWLSQSTIAVVTDKSAYHWPVDGESGPSKKFDRHASLAGAQIINYDASADGKWLSVSGIKPGPSPSEPAVGCTQLYAVTRSKSQTLVSPAGRFCTARVQDRADPAMLFVFVQQSGGKPNLMAIEVGRESDSGAPFRVGPVPFSVPADAGADVAVRVEVSSDDLVYCVTRAGYVYCFDLHTGGAVFRVKAAEGNVFTSAPHEQSKGVLVMTVGTGEINLVQPNRDAIVPFVAGTLRNQSLALELAGRMNLRGADDAYKAQFESMIASGDVSGAIKLAAKSPGTVLRNADTIARLRAMPAPPSGTSPAMQYFSALMKLGRVNRIESVELVKAALEQGKSGLVQKWLREEKLTTSKELGDVVSSFDPKLALEIYQASGESHEQVIQMYVQAGEYDKIVPYAREKGVNPDWAKMLQAVTSRDAKAAQGLASALVKNESGGGSPLLQIDTAVEIFMQFNRLPECTSFLLDVLAADRKEQGYLQTRLLEMNLLGGAPQVVDAILESDMFHHFDHKHIATLCERAGLPRRAMELYEDLADIKRCMASVALDSRQHDALVKFFGSLSPEKGSEALGELLRDKRNEALAVKIAKEYAEAMGAGNLITKFEEAKAMSGLYYFLGGIVNDSEDPEVHYKYITTAAQLKQFKEVERVCRDSPVYDADRVKAFLIDAKLEDPRPLIHVCNRHGYEDELTAYLWNNKLQRFIEVYVTRVSPKACPKVVGKLVDLDADEKFILSLVASVPSNNAPPPDPASLPEGADAPNVCVVGELVAEVEKRNRLRMLQPFLERKVTEGSIDPETHNAIGKIRVMLNKDPREFLNSNQFYDSRALGKFCEKLDPQLAFVAYKRANGDCDEELIDVTNRNGLFKDQARYLVERKDSDLWKKVLDDGNEHRGDLIDQVVGTALPETHDAKAVSVAVRSFIDADLPTQLIGLLEKLVLHGGEFADNKNLQNLLILTAIRCSNAPDAVPGRAMDYIMRLDKFDGPQIASVALKDEFRLYEEAFAIYRKTDMHVEAVSVLIERIGDLGRAAEYADRVDDKEVWAVLGNAQLEAREVGDAVNSLIKSGDAAKYKEVITAASAEGAFEDLVKFLQFARDTQKDRLVDTELAYALAKVGRMPELEVFVTHPNQADIQAVGDRCYDEHLFEAGRILFKSISNYGRMASCLVNLGQFRESVEAARKANSSRTWKEVNKACVAAGEFKLAQQAGLQIIADPDHLDHVVACYEQGGHFDELITLFEAGVGSDGANQGVFTELGIQYSKHRPEKLMEHLKIFHARLNFTKILRAIESARLWGEAAFLQVKHDDFDAAIRTMMDHAPTAFDEDQFVEAILKVRNPDLYYLAVAFFVEEEPLSLNRLLKALKSKLEHARVVHLLRKHDEALRLAMPYLRDVQKDDIPAVNEAVNEILLDEEDYEALRQSVDECQSFDQLDLAKRLEKHELLEFRRIAAHLYKRNRRFEQSVELSKKDRMYPDAIGTAAFSGDENLAEGLLRWFVEEKEDKECFAACLCTCYGLIRADVALELAWRHRITDYVMPFIIQYLRDTDAKIKDIDERTTVKDDGHGAQGGMGAAAGPPGLGGAPLALTNFAANPGMYPGAHEQAPMMGGLGGPMVPGGGGGGPDMGGGYPGAGGGVPGYGGAPQYGMGGGAPGMGMGATHDVYSMGGAGGNPF